MTRNTVIYRNMRYGMIIMIFTLISGLTPLFAEGQEVLPIPRYYTARTLAMGGTQSTLSTGYQAIFANPAGIVRSDGLEFIGIGMGPRVNLDEGMSEHLESWLTEGYRKTEFFVNEDTLVHGDLRNGIGGIYTLSGGGSFWGLGTGMNYTVEPLFLQDREGDPVTIEYLATAAWGVGFSHGFSMGEGTLYLGADLKQVVMSRATAQIDESELLSYLYDEGGALSSLPATVAMGYTFNAGAIYEQGPFLLSMHVKNIGEPKLQTCEAPFENLLMTQYRILDMNGRKGSVLFGHCIPQRGEYLYDSTIPTSAVVGVGIDTGLGDLFRFRIAADYEHVFTDGSATADSLWKSVHLGGEIELFDIISLRAGINQGYLSAGVAVMVANLFRVMDLSFSGTYYAVERGSYAGQYQSEGLLFDIKATLNLDL
ncbi:MAG: hypothetical protein JXK93_11580 [Sphaerochaetaceae bacterium]|nr:hypothetical protein [Sphaerochaetaceae bacterium]